MSDLGAQLRQYLDETAPPVELEEILTQRIGLEQVRPIADRVARRRWPGWAIGLAAAVAVLLLAGGVAWLAGSLGRESTPVISPIPVPQTPTPTTTAAAAASFPEAGPLGAVVVEPREAIQLRTLQMITGPAEFIGHDQVRGVELAVEDFGDVLGHPVELGQPWDSFCGDEGSSRGAREIVAEPDVLAVIGTTCSYPGAAGTASQILSQAGLILFSGSHMSPAMTSDMQGNAGTAWQPGYYRTAPSDLVQGAIAATFVIEELGLTRAAVIHDNGGRLGDSEELGQAFADSFESQGGTITAIREVRIEDQDMVPLLTEIADGKPEVIYLPIHQPTADFILLQLGDVAGLDEVVLIGADALLWWYGESFISIPESEGMYFSGPAVPQAGNVGLTGTTYDELASRYQTTYREAPSTPLFAYAYDATMILLSAIEQVAIENPDGTLFIDRQALRDALYATVNFPGVTGTLSCDQFGDCGSQAVAVYFHEDATQPELAQQNVVFP